MSLPPRFSACRTPLHWARAAWPTFATTLAVRLDQSTRAPSMASLLLSALS